MLGRVRPLRGSGELVLPRMVDGAANPALALLTVGRLVRFSTADWVWTMELEDPSDVVVSEQEEAGEVVTWTGGDWLTARMAKAHVQPDAGYGVLPWYPTRWFNFSADRLRDDDPAGPQGAWPFATGQLPNYDSDNYFGRPEGFVDTAGPAGSGPEWLWNSDTRTVFAAAGVCYFRQRFTLASDALVMWQLAADDEGELWVDGVPVCRVEGVYKGGAVVASVQMSAGEHLIGCWGRNRNALRAGVVYAGWSVSDGMPDTLLVRSDASLARVLGYPADPPGFTPTEVLRLVVDEEQTNGGLTGVSFSFTSAADTDGAPVTEVTDIAAPAPGSSLLTLFQMLAETYLDIDGDPLPGTDVEANPDRLLVDAWVRGTRGSDKSASVVFGKGTARLVRHEAKGSERATVALVTGSSFAPFVVEHADVLTLGRFTVPLDFGDASAATAEKWAGEYLLLVAEARRGIAVELGPGSYVPGADFDIGDTVGVLESDGTVGDHRIAGWGFELDASSVVKYSVELDQPAAVLEERLSAFMRRFAPGGAGGRTILPSPTQPQFVSNQSGSEKTAPGWSAPKTGTVVLTKNGTPIPGASITGTDKVTLTDAARKFTANSDEFDITIDGVVGTDAPWKPTDGRWLQEFSVNTGPNGVTIEVKYL